MDPAKSQARYGSFGLSVLPADADIQTVTVSVEWAVSAGNAQATLTAQAYLGGSAYGTALVNTSKPTTDTAQSFALTGLTRNDLATGNFEVEVRASRGNGGPGFTARLDAVSVTVDEMRGRAEAALPTPGPFHMPAPRIALAVAGGPRRSVLRPEEIEDQALARRLQQEATFGPAAVLDPAEVTQVLRSGHTLSVNQTNAALRVDEDGTLAIGQPVWDPHARGLMPAVIHEEVVERLERALLLAGSVLEQLDPLHRLSDVVPAATIIGPSYGAWRSRSEQERSPNQMALNVQGRERPVVTLVAPRIHRAALVSQAPQIARDLAVLLRRAMTERT